MFDLLIIDMLARERRSELLDSAGRVRSARRLRAQARRAAPTDRRWRSRPAR
jgi:hypothetical protein